MNVVILLTTTVHVNNNKHFILQKNPVERINTYLKSILEWLRETSLKIVVVENSGYDFKILKPLLEEHKDRFEIISFDEETVDPDSYKTNSKGTSELLSINYAYNNSKLIKEGDFIIKITGRYFVPELEEYLKNFNLNEYDCLRQHNFNRCEMVGSSYKNFNVIFNKEIENYYGHIEHVWRDRILLFKNIITCKVFQIEKTQMGGADYFYTNF